MKTLTIWFIDEATMCCWLMKTTFKLIYGLPMKKQTPTCISVISITHCTDFLMFPLLFLPLLFHLHVQYLLLHHRLFGENYIHIAIMYLLPKTIALQLQLPSPNNFIIKIELFYIYFSRILATGAEQLFSWTPPSCWTPLVVKIIKIHVKKFIVNKASDLHPTALIKIGLFHRYFSRVLATGVKQLFCWKSPSGCLRKS